MRSRFDDKDRFLPSSVVLTTHLCFSGNRLVTREVGTDRPHPASRAGILSLRPNELPIPTTTRVYGELAACLTTFVDDGSLRFRIFNWKTGALITESVRISISFLVLRPFV